MDVAINIEKLIKVIKKQPTLYVTSNKDYYDRFKRRQLWEEVCSTLHPSWDSASEKERMLYGKLVFQYGIYCLSGAAVLWQLCMGSSVRFPGRDKKFYRDYSV